MALGNQDLAQRTGLPKPTVTRLTHTLCELGYLIHLPREGGYHLGPAVLGLGYTMLSGLEIRDRARPLIRALADESDCAVALGVRDQLNLVYIECARGCSRITLALDVGSRIPLALTAMGRAVYASLPADERAAILESLRERDPDSFPRVEAGLAQALEDQARWGFVTSFGEWQGEVNAIGAALCLPGQEQVYALNCGGPAFLTEPSRLIEEVGPKLVVLARSLSNGALEPAT
ncbi:MAG: IclR family transcriptional regulator [Rhodospirillales bacterium]